MSSGKRQVRTNTVMDSKCQEFNIQFDFSVFMSWIFIMCVMGSVCVVKGIAEKVYRGRGLKVRIIREIGGEEDWGEAKGWAPVTHRGTDLSGSLGCSCVAPRLCSPAPSVTAESQGSSFSLWQRWIPNRVPHVETVSQHIPSKAGGNGSFVSM